MPIIILSTTLLFHFLEFWCKRLFKFKIFILFQYIHNFKGKSIKMLTNMIVDIVSTHQNCVCLIYPSNNITYLYNIILHHFLTSERKRLKISLNPLTTHPKFRTILLETTCHPTKIEHPPQSTQ